MKQVLGFTQEEWLQDPVRWYQQVHPDDKQRWSVEAAQLFLSGEPLRSAYRVLARDGRVIWFHCEAKMIRREDGRPWFIHGVGFDITDLKKTEEALQEERNVVSAILDTVGALVVVLDPAGRIIRFNRACEQTTGYAFEEVRYKYVWELFTVTDEADHFRAIFEQMRAGQVQNEYESHWVTRDGSRRLISWSGTALPGDRGTAGLHHRHRNRHHRAQAPGAGGPRHQRPRAAPHRSGPARRIGPAFDRHRLHE